ncbi:MAG TPA: PIN domain-containing protein [Blastocatellia bacterium]|nr:PIN domain-containing protein [Blastocatellia bacterium]
MLYLADTNIFLRLAEPKHPMHVETKRAINALAAKGDNIGAVPQNIIEFWNVATRPADKNGLGYTLHQTRVEVERIESFFPLVLDTPAIYAEWKRLVIAHAIEGKQVHDARIVAAMNVHGITHLLTYNKDHFVRFVGIIVVSPPEVVLSQLVPAVAKSEEKDEAVE